MPTGRSLWPQHAPTVVRRRGACRRMEGKRIMARWSQAMPECPVDPPTREWIERRWTWLTEAFGRERVRSVPVVLPAPEFFPDPYAGSDDDARVMLDRVCGYMGIAPDTVELSLYQDRNPVYEGEWRQGT